MLDNQAASVEFVKGVVAIFFGLVAFFGVLFPTLLLGGYFGC